MEIGIKSKGSPEAIKPIHPTEGVNNPPARGNGDTAEISELAILLSRKAKIETQLLALEALHEDGHTDNEVRKFMDNLKQELQKINEQIKVLNKENL
jgi:hypothetical protein